MVEKRWKSKTEMKHVRKNRGGLDKQANNISKQYFSTSWQFCSIH